MAPVRHRIEDLAQHVASGRDVDWDAALDSDLTSDERCALEQLRAVEGIARRARERSRRFTTTEWSLVLAAAGTERPESKKALESLCRRYWYPVYAEVRSAGRDADQSRDLTQGFFVQLLERNSLAVANPDRGKFRNFLRTAVKNYLSNETAREQALKRGGGVSFIALDLVAVEKQYARELAHTRTPDQLFDQRWARTLLEHALDRLRDEMDKAGSLKRYERLAPMLTGPDDSTRYKDLAVRWDTSEAAIKMAVHRMRRRLRKLLRLEIAHTVDDPREVNEEIRFLLKALDS